tara:strand:- start:5235 stop:6260 length:1026 start_codon:yes stop_codon:yes gene_type:complete
MVGEGRDLVANSVRIEGDLKVCNTGNTRATNQHVQFNPNVGIHGICEAVSVEFENVGVVQRLNEYARLVHMGQMATKDRNDLLNTLDQVELKSPDVRYSQQYCYGITDPNDTNTIVRDVDFSFMPEICVNKMAGGNLSMDKTGYIKVTLNLARDVAFLYGRDVDQNYNYQIRNLRLTYKSVPAQGEGKVQMRSSVMIKNSVLSSFSNTSAKVPAVCDACSISFLQQNKENTFLNDNLACETMPKVTELQFLFNDTSAYIRYVINDKADMVRKYLESIESGSTNQVNADKWKSNNNFGLGISFNNFVDLSNSKFNTQINSSDANINNRPMVMFSYFHTVVEV